MSSGGYQISNKLKRDLFDIKNDVLEIKRMTDLHGQAKESMSRILKILDKYVEV